MKQPPDTRIAVPPGDEASIPKILEGLNRFLRYFADGVNKNITFSENIASQEVDVEFTTSVSYSIGVFEPIIIQKQAMRTVRHVLITRVVMTENENMIMTTAVMPTWREDGRTVRIEYVAGLDPNNKYRITLLII